MQQQHGKKHSSMKYFSKTSFFFIRDEEKRKMYHSISLKNLQQLPITLSNNDEEQIHELISTLVDNIDKEMSDSNGPSVMLFNASSNNRHRVSSENNDDLLQSFDECKHSSGILVDDKDIISCKNYFILKFLFKLLI